MRKQLQVVKVDGSMEEYLHTKVWATLNHAFDSIDESDTFMTEQLADVVTYYLYQDPTKKEVPSNEILAVIKVVLTNTGYDEAALALSEHHHDRHIRRTRTEVIDLDIQDWSDTQGLRQATEVSQRSPWNKSIIVDDLITRYGLTLQTARAIASMAEERILNMRLAAVPSGLIKQLVLSDTVSVLRAQDELQLVQ